jgi:dethiobiotin synthetase
MRGLFVTGTDTGAGKTVLSACLLAAMSDAGERVHAYKPVLTGLDEPPDGLWPADHELLSLAGGGDPAAVSPLRFGPAVSPHLAAQLAGDPISPERLVAHAHALAAGASALLVEGVGGLLVPLSSSYSIADLAVALELPVIVAARAGLGTINHTLLTLEAARTRGLDVRAVVLTPWPSQPSPLERSNRDSIAALGAVEVGTLARLTAPDPAAMAHAGSVLPWGRWLDA